MPNFSPPSRPLPSPPPFPPLLLPPGLTSPASATTAAASLRLARLLSQLRGALAACPHLLAVTGFEAALRNASDLSHLALPEPPRQFRSRGRGARGQQLDGSQGAGREEGQEGGWGEEGRGVCWRLAEWVLGDGGPVVPAALAGVALAPLVQLCRALQVRVHAWACACAQAQVLINPLPMSVRTCTPLAGHVHHLGSSLAPPPPTPCRWQGSFTASLVLLRHHLFITLQLTC